MDVRPRRPPDRALRPPMRPPGRPKAARRVQQQQFWVNIARGLSSEDAAVAVGVSSVVGTRWFRDSGGMPSISLAPLSGLHLNLQSERRSQSCAQVVRVFVRSRAASVVRRRRSRGLRRSAASRRGGAASVRAIGRAHPSVFNRPRAATHP